MWEVRSSSSSHQHCWACFESVRVIVIPIVKEPGCLISRTHLLCEMWEIQESPPKAELSPNPALNLYLSHSGRARIQSSPFAGSATFTSLPLFHFTFAAVPDRSTRKAARRSGHGIPNLPQRRRIAPVLQVSPYRSCAVQSVVFTRVTAIVPAARPASFPAYAPPPAPSAATDPDSSARLLLQQAKGQRTTTRR